MKFLLAVERSAHSDKAVAEAGRLASAAGAEVVVAHQRNDTAADLGSTVPLPAGAEQAQSLVDSAVALVAAGVRSARGRVLRGLQGEEAQAILKVAREEADMIVVGPRGIGRLAGLLVGSVTNRSVQISDRPVLVVL